MGVIAGRVRGGGRVERRSCAGTRWVQGGRQGGRQMICPGDSYEAGVWSRRRGVAELGGVYAFVAVELRR